MSRWRSAFGVVTTFLPTRRLAIAVAVLALPWLLSGWRAGLVLATLASVALIVMVALDIALLPGIRDLDVEREAPLTLGVGDTGSGRYRVRRRHAGSDIPTFRPRA